MYICIHIYQAPASLTTWLRPHKEITHNKIPRDTILKYRMTEQTKEQQYTLKEQSADLFRASTVLDLQKQTIPHPAYLPTYQPTNQPAILPTNQPTNQPTSQPTNQPNNRRLASLPSHVRTCLPSRPSLRTCFPSRPSRFHQPTPCKPPPKPLPNVRPKHP